MAVIPRVSAELPEKKKIKIKVIDAALIVGHGELIVASAVEDVDGVRQQMGNGLQGFDGAFGAAGKIYDDGAGAYGGDGAG